MNSHQSATIIDPIEGPEARETPASDLQAGNPFLGREQDGRSAPPQEPPIDPEYWRAAEVEEIKDALYWLDIDAVDQIEDLNRFVVIDPEDVENFRDGGWSGVDDWKRNEDGFVIERMDDGRMMFIPDEETMRSYSFFETETIFQYDDGLEAFVNEVDYYGKPVVNVVKFLRDDVLVRMTVSGEKVDLNLYQQDPQRR
ncbi:MAG: hypothetical protein P8M78_00720 [Myxococcota bacterium]|nr:hypothetical protein [Myxococcota bacterium]